jgi:ATP-dependent protease ClpP protease subunit
MSLAALIKLRCLTATAVVTGECSSAALWPFAACERRMVMPYSVFLFHPMKWQSEEHVGLHEAAEWARHFAELERDMDRMLVEMFGQAQGEVTDWIAGGKYVSGRELAAAGLAELVDLRRLDLFGFGGAPAEYPVHGARPVRSKRHRSPRLAPVAKARKSLKNDRRRQ